ncbi:DUF3127 domain-containing protein [Portibacter lacus]|uniref:DUF3127 domain-containing protein n=1 Tax=Portibacter lacus TaxID=1099794 RepID=A0AA37SRB9_9BACT|nr:DUF3127 domain-containing protein [Portibacter lacus]GLR16878.1 hypothetical protein GCM10007940_14930 [Portibacter lacus]
MAYEMVGKLHKKFDTESKTSSFQAREFVVESTDSTYTQYIKFQLTQDRCGIIDNINEGDELKVFFDLRGREWNEKYFTNLNAWKVEAHSASAAAPSGPPASSDPFPSEPANTDAGSGQAKVEDFDDLPF